MADEEKQLELAPLGTREKAIEVSVDVAVTAGEDTITTVTHTFDKPFVHTPKLLGGPHYEDGTELIKGNIGVTALSITQMDISIYQSITADVASATYKVKADLVGWVAA